MYALFFAQVGVVCFFSEKSLDKAFYMEKSIKAK